MTDGTKSSCKHSGFKAQKDRLTLLLCNNAAGFMHKSGLIYKSFNPWTRKNTAYICGTQWTNLDHQNPCIQLVPSELYLSSQELPPKSAYGFQRVANHRQYWTTTPSFDCLNLSVWYQNCKRRLRNGIIIWSIIFFNAINTTSSPTRSSTQRQQLPIEYCHFTRFSMLWGVSNDSVLPFVIIVSYSFKQL